MQFGTWSVMFSEATTGRPHGRCGLRPSLDALLAQCIVHGYKLTFSINRFQKQPHPMLIIYGNPFRN